MVADMEVDMVADNFFVSRIFLRPNFFEPKLTPDYASSKFCDLIFIDVAVSNDAPQLVQQQITIF